MKHHAPTLLLTLLLPLLASSTATAQSGVVACPSTRSVTFFVTSRRHPNNFDVNGATTTILKTTGFKNATRKRGGFYCHYKTNINEIVGTIMAKKGGCTQFGTGWDARGTVCTDANPANCRAICP